MAKELMNKDCGLFVNIDDDEAHYLKIMCDGLFGRDNFVRNVVWQKRTSPDMRAALGDGHDHIMVFAKYAGSFRDSAKRIPKTEDQRSAFKNPDNDPRGPWVSSDFTAQGYRPNQMYKIVTPGGTEYFPPEGRCWKNVEKVYLQLVEEGRMWFGEDSKGVPRRKTYLAESEDNAVWSWWTNREVGHNQEAKKESIAFFGVAGAFMTPKPERLARRIVHISSDRESAILDYFAGSGTTGHAVINLNREDSGKRRFILVEIGEYFDTVLLPRIKKVTFSPEWKDGKPKRMATQEEAERSPRVFKYIRLESYEDAVNNIEFDEASGQRALEFEDYLLKYMLKWETRASETMLNVEKLARPFSYKLHIHSDGQTHEKVADIPETFNYLLGLHVQTRKVYDDDGPACAEASAGRRRYLVYRGRIDHRRIVVIWRETEGWEKADLARDKKFVAEQKLTEGADEVFVNSDSVIPNAKALEPMFKARMFAEVQA